MGRFKELMRRTFPGLFLAARRRREARLAARAPDEVFTEIYRKNVWKDNASRSGQGSNLEQTAAIRVALPALLAELGCTTMLDVPCGDYYWLRLVRLPVEYLGGDIVAELVATNEAQFGDARHRFAVMNLIEGPLPHADLILNRDCLVHFSFAHARGAIESIRQSGAEYLLTTTFTDRDHNDDIPTGAWRPINLQRAPYHFPPPLRLIDERCPAPGYADKQLGLWRIADLPAIPA
jgi:hypothetical protein